MANLPSLLINAVTTFDGKALSKGQTQISKFQRQLKSLAGTFGVAFGGAALVAYSKKSILAYGEQIQEVKRLNTAVSNLGLAFASDDINKYIDSVEAATGVNRDLLQPSFIALLQATGSVTKSQEILNVSLNAAAGLGESVASVSEKLTQAYLGNTRGLRTLNLGLSKTELQTVSFEKVMALLQARFKGQAALEAASYTSQMAKLGIKADEASEIIGKGLVDALKILGGSTDIKELTDDIDRAATSTAKLIVEMAKLGRAIKTSLDLPADIFTKFVQKTQPLVDLIVEGDPSGFMKKPRASARRFFTGGSTGPTANDRAAAKAEADAIKRQKELLALQKKAAIAEKNKIALSKAAAVFDTNRVSLAAALKATYDKETRLRLEALTAIEEDNGTLALQKIKELATLQKNTDLAKLAGIDEISNATLQALNTQLLTELRNINATKIAEGDKELLREEAFKKYNAAITAAGVLAAKESYNERVQVQLTEIARLASLSNTTNAVITQNLLRESAELSMIDRVANAQKRADDARAKALQDYIRLLNSAPSGVSGGGGGGGTGGGGTGGLTNTNILEDLKSKPTSALTPMEVSGLRYAAQAEAQYKESLKKISLTDKVASQSLNQGLNAGLSLSSALSGARYAAQAAAQYNITVNAGVGDPEAIARTLEDVLNQSSYRGTSTNRGSGVYIK
jgi:hypothetical protein